MQKCPSTKSLGAICNALMCASQYLPSYSTMYIGHFKGIHCSSIFFFFKDYNHICLVQHGILLLLLIGESSN